MTLVPLLTAIAMIRTIGAQFRALDKKTTHKYLHRYFTAENDEQAIGYFTLSLDGSIQEFQVNLIGNRY